MKSVSELTDKELRQAYVYATDRYNESRKEKKSIEEEFYRRYKRDLEENRT